MNYVQPTWECCELHWSKKNSRNTQIQARMAACLHEGALKTPLREEDGDFSLFMEIIWQEKQKLHSVQINSE